MARKTRKGATVYRGRIAEQLANRLNCSPSFGGEILSALTGILSDHLFAGRRVCLSGFGEFYLKRVGRKPMKVGFHNKRQIVIEPHAVPAWRPSPPFKKRLRAVTTEGARG